MYFHATKHLLIGTIVGVVCLMASCESSTQLPILGVKQLVNGDTIYHTIPDFEFINQDSISISQELFENKIYVTDFFFTSCPTICPKMKQQMLRIHDAYKDQPEVLLLSHSIDPTYDTPSVLQKYAESLGISSDKWHLVTGDQQAIYDMAYEYLVSVAEDSSVPGGYIHGGHFILIDKNRRIRGYYDGTKKEEVDQLMKDIQLLLEVSG